MEWFTPAIEQFVVHRQNQFEATVHLTPEELTMIGSLRLHGNPHQEIIFREVGIFEAIVDRLETIKNTDTRESALLLAELERTRATLLVVCSTLPNQSTPLAAAINNALKKCP